MKLATNEQLSDTIRWMRADQEKDRMDFLSDPKNQFCYAIKADGRCSVEKPIDGVFSSLRAAIDEILDRKRTGKLK